MFGLSLADFLAAQAASAADQATARGASFGKAKRCIVLFSWGGMSHIDTWDPKPEAGSDIRSIFQPIESAVSGIQLTQIMPQLAARTDKLAIVRSVQHLAADHRAAGYWNLTGHPPRLLQAPAILPSREDWPCIGSMVSLALEDDARRKNALPGTVSIPYPIADRGLLYGQYAGILGTKYDPVYVKPDGGQPFKGVSPETGMLRMDPVEGVSRERIESRRSLLGQLDGAAQKLLDDESLSPAKQYRERAFDMVLASGVREAFDVSKERAELRAKYGDHICGQSVLMARRLTDAGVPLVTVFCSAGDLNGSIGDHWDTHGDGFNRLKNDLVPPLDTASAALLDDLSQSGKLEETLVVWLTEFGRTPRLAGGGGRDHFPSCYSVAFAGGGIRGGQVYGRSDKIGSEPAGAPCGPAELHATIFHALGIDARTTFTDLQGRPRYLSEAEPLPLF